MAPGTGYVCCGFRKKPKGVIFGAPPESMQPNAAYQWLEEGDVVWSEER